MGDDDNNSSVRVAVRIRPQIPREIIDMCRICTQVTPGEPQVVLGTDKAFTFDYVFDTNSDQVTIYTDSVEKLVNGALKGYNATVLAYGQTGSGKTYTMGTGFDRDISECHEGIIPRAVRHLFAGIQTLQENPYDDEGTYLGSLQFSVACQFMELYNEEVIDLLDPYSKGRVFKIHEDTTGSISIAGATIRPLKGPQDALLSLQQGALARTTASTNMNELSSRSHALFTILIRRQRVMSADESGMPEGDLETLTSKFHFVDLAGSERLKRTGATGERAREGISINCGLLALGNVISALGDVTKKALHVPYRDSKLTRLLQDSLGGNSQTVMIACVSPSDRDFMETLNTLKYANRARNIKNRVQINQDQSSRTIGQLRREIAALQLEILEYKQGKRSIDAEGNAAISDTSLENAMLIADNKRLQQRLKAMQETINALTERNAILLSEKAMFGWTSDGNDMAMSEMVSNYISEIEQLKAKLIESEQMFQQLKKSQASPPKNALKSSVSYMNEVTQNPSELINMAKRELEKERELLMSKSLPGLPESEAQDRSSQENDSDSDESDTESDDKTTELQAEINDIQSDIEIKTKLIEQLELSQQRMTIMKQHYEEKLNVLSAKISNTQKERDQVLQNMGSVTTSDQSTKMKKVRDEYERKLSDMQKELRKLQQAQKEHVRQQRELQAQDSQLKSLRQELTELKQIKIKLMRKSTEDFNRYKNEEARRAREISQLRKETRKQNTMIQSLQAKGAAKDQVLRRKTEEVSALRKSQKSSMLSTKAQGRVPVKKGSDVFHPRQARIKWDTLQRTIGKSARSKQAVIELERELERLLQERDQLSRDLSVIKKRQKIQNTSELVSEEDSIQANLSYIQENIEQIQNSIMELEEGKESATEQLSLQNLLENIKSLEEAKFLIDKLCNSSIIQACDVGLTHTRLKEKEALLTQVQQDTTIQQQLLQHVLARNPAFLTPTDGPVNGNSVTIDQRSNANDTSTHSSRSPSPINSETDIQARSKVRKQAPMAQELLFGDVTNGNQRDDEMSRSYTIQEGTKSSLIPLARVPSAPGSLKDQLRQGGGLMPNVPLTRQHSAIAASPMFNRKYDSTSTTGMNVPQSPRLTRRQFPNKASPGFEDACEMPPPSPPIYRRVISREDGDVFSRLGAGTSDPTPGGSIKDFNGRMKVGSPLLCTHIVEGHSNSVLSIKASDSLLFTAAADRTCKVWDLRTGATPHCLSAHPGPVVGVEYDKSSKILFSASGAFIRTWDLRESNIRPIKTLCSSGVALSGAASLTSIPTGEAPITALKMGASGNLYTAASDKVRIWDLRMFSCIGKLAGGHQAAVMCVTTWEGPGNTDYVATGSKDHYVKVFEVASSGGTVLPLLNLEPPHYDGVQALAVAKGAVGVDAELFSGSRDSGIKRWDLRNGELKQSLNNAHKGWVSGMTIYSDILLSCCRGGLIRLWNVKTCDALAEMKTEASINDITSADNRIFTASNDGKVRVYRLSSAIRRLSQENR